MSEANKTQIDLWDGRVGEKWVAYQANLDAMLSHVTAELTLRAGNISDLRVLDIGCGTGETCIHWLEGGALVTGVDISSPMLALAQKRTNGKVTLIKADASTWLSDAPFDLAVSQFGVMFFDNPEAAFKNIANNIRKDGRLLFACWCPPSENSWATAPINAIRALLPEMPTTDPQAPGPFALADKTRLTKILEDASFTNINIEFFNFPVCMAREGGVEAAAHFATQVGPAGWALAEASDELRAKAIERIKAALKPYEKKGAVTLSGSAWIVEAVRAGL